MDELTAEYNEEIMDKVFGFLPEMQPLVGLRFLCGRKLHKISCCEYGAASDRKVVRKAAEAFLLFLYRCYMSGLPHRTAYDTISAASCTGDILPANFALRTGIIVAVITAMYALAYMPWAMLDRRRRNHS